MRFFTILIAIILFFKNNGVNGASYNINTCAKLQNISADLAGVYTLTANIDCTGYNFMSISEFTGTLDGGGHKIINFTNSQNGIFVNATNAILRNFDLINFNISVLNNGNIGAVVGTCFSSCSISNITLNTSTPSLSNVFKITNDSNTIIYNRNYGAIAGSFSGTITNCIIQNTVVIINIYGGQNNGGLVGKLIGSLSNCHNLGFQSNSSAIILDTIQAISGGLIGQLGSPACSVTNSGIHQGTMLFRSNFGFIFGGIIGQYGGYGLNLTQLYVNSGVSILADTNVYEVGGILGQFQVLVNNTYLLINNVYSKATITGRSIGGLVGDFQGTSNTLTMQINNTYISSVITSSGTSGNIIGGSTVDQSTVGVCTFYRVFYNNEANSYGDLVSINSTDGSSPLSVGCNQLYSNVTSLFSSSIWTGDALKIEYVSNSGANLCSIPSTLIPSTTTPSTTIPSTPVPSTLIPSTTTPSTTVPSTTIPTTATPSTTIPSTRIPSTTIPSTQVPSTTTPSTEIPSTFLPIVCLYKVPNCEKCGSNGIIVDLSQFDVSCILTSSDWAYSFSNKTSNTVFIDQILVFNGTNIVINGDFNQTSSSSFALVVSPQNHAPFLNVSGCVSLFGNISLILEEKPQNGDSSIFLISYNCSNTIQLRNSQFVVKPTYKNNQCDKIGSTLNNQQGSLSVALSTSLNSNCKGLSTGAIVGIVLGVVGASIIVIVVGSVLYWYRNREFDKKLKYNIEMN